MSDRKIVVPQGMLQAAGKASGGVDPDGVFLYVPLTAALEWLADNFVRPTGEQLSKMVKERHDADPKHWESLAEWERAMILICEWQRRMFLAPDPPVDPLVMYIKRHFDDILISDAAKAQLEPRAKAAAHDYQEHVKRNGGGQ